MTRIQTGEKSTSAWPYCQYTGSGNFSVLFNLKAISLQRCYFVSFESFWFPALKSEIPQRVVCTQVKLVWLMCNLGGDWGVSSWNGAVTHANYGFNRMAGSRMDRRLTGPGQMLSSQVLRNQAHVLPLPVLTVLTSLCLGRSACCCQAARTGDTGHGTHLTGWPPFSANCITSPAGSRKSRLFDWRIPAPPWAPLLLLLSNSRVWHPHCAADSVPILKSKFYL